MSVEPEYPQEPLARAMRTLADKEVITPQLRVKCRNCTYGRRDLGRLYVQGNAIAHALKHRGHRVEIFDHNVHVVSFRYDQESLSDVPPF